MKISLTTLFKDRKDKKHIPAYIIFDASPETLDKLLKECFFPSLTDNNTIYIFIDNFYPQMREALNKYGWVEHQDFAGEVWFTHYKQDDIQNKKMFCFDNNIKDYPIKILYE